jgi:hypothetical protein
MKTSYSSDDFRLTLRHRLLMWLARGRPVLLNCDIRVIACQEGSAQVVVEGDHLFAANCAFHPIPPNRAILFKPVRR